VMCGCVSRPVSIGLWITSSLMLACLHECWLFICGSVVCV